MIQKERTRNVEVSGVTRQENFKIKAGAKAFKILSDGLYSDKIAAIVRELSANAYDAHVAAGKADVPIRVRLPDTFSPIFEVQDYGIGLSEDDIYQVYTTYFESTKTDSNDFTGCLGLGSKTPFSYSDSFTVRSVHDGVARTFSAIIGAAGFPEIIKMSEREVSESNGVTIRLDVDQNDIRAFERAAQTQLRYFPTPIDINTEIEYFNFDHKAELEGDNWKIFKDSHCHGYGRGTSNVAIQGVVGYPINDSQVMSGCDQDDRNIVDRVLNRTDGKIVFTFPIGKLDIAASREELSYDRETQKNLLEACREIHDIIIKRENDNLKNAKNLWEAFCIAYQSSSGVLRRWGLSHTWQGKQVEVIGYEIDIKKLFPRDETNWADFVPRAPKNNGGELKIERKKGLRACEPLLQPHSVVWFGDDKFSRSRYLTFLKQQNWSISEGAGRVLYIDLNSLQNNTVDDVIEQFKMLHPGVPFFRASDYERQNSGAGSKPDHLKQNLFTLNEGPSWMCDPRNYWKLESDDSGVLVVIDRFYPINYTHNGVTHHSIEEGYEKARLNQNLSDMIKKLKSQKIIPKDFKLHGVKKRAAADLLKTGKWEFLDTYLAKAIIKHGGSDLKILRNWQSVQQLDSVYEQIIDRVHDAYRTNPKRQRSTAEQNALEFYKLKKAWREKSMRLMNQWGEAFNIAGHTPEIKAIKADFDVDKLKKQLEPLEILSLVRHAYTEKDRRMIDKFLQKAL